MRNRTCLRFLQREHQTSIIFCFPLQCASTVRKRVSSAVFVACGTIACALSFLVSFRSILSTSAAISSCFCLPPHVVISATTNRLTNQLHYFNALAQHQSGTKVGGEAARSRVGGTIPRWFNGERSCARGAWCARDIAERSRLTQHCVQGRSQFVYRTRIRR